LIFVIGVVVITLVALAEITDPADWGRPGAQQHRENALTGYRDAVVILLCTVNFFEFRHGLASVVGLPEVASWVLAPIGLIVLILVGFATWLEDISRWKWAAIFVSWVGALAGYIIVVALERS
jgi:hypothetical protein